MPPVDSLPSVKVTVTESLKALVENAHAKLFLGFAGGAAGVSVSFIDALTSWVRCATAIAGFISVLLGIYWGWKARNKKGP